MSRGKKKSSLRDLTRETPSSKDRQAILQHITSFAKAVDVPLGTDRLIAISLAAYMDQFVEEGILRNLKNTDSDTLDELFSDHGALATFSSKIQMAYAMGTIDKETKQDLDRIRRIRNVFAHAKTSVTFDTPLVAKECRKFNPLRLLGLDETLSAQTMKEMNPRQHFLAAACFMLWVQELRKFDYLKQMISQSMKHFPDGGTKLIEFIDKLQAAFDIKTRVKQHLAASAAASKESS